MLLKISIIFKVRDLPYLLSVSSRVVFCHPRPELSNGLCVANISVDTIECRPSVAWIWATQSLQFSFFFSPSSFVRYCLLACHQRERAPLISSPFIVSDQPNARGTTANVSCISVSTKAENGYSKQGISFCKPLWPCTFLAAQGNPAPEECPDTRRSSPQNQLKYWGTCCS